MSNCLPTIHAQDINEVSLSDLALKYKSDKLFEGYTKYYDMFFYELKDSNVILLEIGVFHGASVKMWEEYFCKGRIVGIDIDPSCTKVNSDRISVHIGDQKDHEFLNSVIAEIGQPNIIIDDGGHKMSQQTITFETLFRALKSGGIYVIEDLHTSYVDTFKDMPITTVQYLVGMIDDLNLHGKRGKVKRDILNYFESSIESLCFFNSICFIKKRASTDMPKGISIVE